LTNWQSIIIAIPVLLFSLTFHEAAHAWMADRRGDDTARLAGRLTLNPIPHIDLIGTILLPIILILVGSPFIFGAAKPVPVDLRNLRNPKKDHLAIALIGPASNLTLAIFFTIALQVAYLFGLDPFLQSSGITAQGIVLMFLHYGILVNLILGGFNLLPIPPLDGSTLLMTFLPPKAVYWVSRLAPFGFFIIIGLFWLGLLAPYFQIFNWLYSVLVIPF